MSLDGNGRAVPKLARLDAKAFDRALALYRSGSHEVAKSLLERLVLQEPEHAGARYVLGLVAWSLRDEARAEARFGEACERQPSNAGFYSNWAEAARRLGKLETAIERFEHALALDDSIVESHFNLGLARSGAGHLQQARESFRRALELSPNDGRVRRRLAQAHHDLGELDEAVTVLERCAADDARALGAGDGAVSSR